MLREIGIDYTFEPTDREVLELNLRKFTYSTMVFDGKDILKYNKDVWVFNNREDALILINEWNRKAMYGANKNKLYSYHLNP